MVYPEKDVRHNDTSRPERKSVLHNFPMGQPDGRLDRWARKKALRQMTFLRPSWGIAHLEVREELAWERPENCPCFSTGQSLIFAIAPEVIRLLAGPWRLSSTRGRGNQKTDFDQAPKKTLGTED